MYRKVEVQMWGDEKVRRLSPPPPSGQTLWFRLLTGPEVTALPGLICAGKLQLAEALGWSPVALQRCFAELEREGLASADWTARVVFIPNAVKHNRPENPNQVVAWRRHWDLVPDCELKYRGLLPLWNCVRTMKATFVEAFLRVFPEFAERFPEELPKQFREPSGEPSGQGSGNQEQEQEQEQEHEQELTPQETPESLLPPVPSETSGSGDADLAQLLARLAAHPFTQQILDPEQVLATMRRGYPGVDVHLEAEMFLAQLTDEVAAQHRRAGRSAAKALMNWIKKAAEIAAREPDNGRRNRPEGRTGAPRRTPGGAGDPAADPYAADRERMRQQRAEFAARAAAGGGET